MNKFIVVTGGTKGIGLAILQKFAQQGFDVATCSRSQKDLDTLKSELEKQHSCNVIVVKADMSKRNDIKVFSDAVIKLNRPVDVLVNNAGYFAQGQICTEPEGTLENTMEANVYSAYYMTRELVSLMKKNKKGHIFNMCSVASIKAYPSGASYGISKFALLGFSKVLREELKKYGIRVTAVMPGATRTASWEKSDLPEDRFMKSEDIADLVYASHALSDKSVVEEIVIRPQLGDI
ncbi:MAG: SDR family oxidoreductase [Flammeovirgaceae bacterium]|nr:SDR family oxidoreductase [Flammeovirgaceae bacterium]